MATMNTALWTTERQTEMYRFFSVAFNAAPGTTYMDQLYDAVISGMSTKEIVNVFVTKSEFTSVYPRSMPNATFATKIVDAVVGSSATAAAKAQAAADITAALTAGWSRGDIVYQIFTNLATKPATDADWAGTAKQMANQVEVARYYTETLNKGGTDLTTLQKVVAGVTATTDTTSVAALAAVIDTALPAASQNFNLTTGADKFTGGSGNDTFVGGEVAGAATWTAGDALDGGAGTDSLLVSVAGNIAAPAGSTLKNIETATLTGGGSVSVNSSDWTGLTALSTTGVGSSTVMAGTSTAVTVTTTAATGAVAVDGGAGVTVTTTGNGTNTIGGGTAPAGAVAVTVTGDYTDGANSATGAIAISGGSTVTVTQSAGLTAAEINAAKSDTSNFTHSQGAVAVTGGASTTTVSVSQQAAQTKVDSATAGVIGVNAGAVTITDLNASSTTKAGTITDVTLANYGNSSINASALTSVTLSGGSSTTGGASGTLSIDRGSLTVPPTASALTINVKGGSLGAITNADTAGNGDQYTAITINGSTAATTIADLAASKATSLTISGDKSVTLTAADLVDDAQFKSVTVSGTGGSSIGTELGAGVAYTGGDGNDVVKIGATTKAISMGAGDDTVTLSSGSITGSIDGGAGSADTITMAYSVASGASATLLSRIMGFERLSVTGTPGAGTSINLANFGAINYVSSSSTGADVTFTNAAASPTVVQSAALAATLTVALADSTGSSDVASVKLTASSAATFNGVSVAGVETINIESDDTSATPNADVHIISTLTAPQVKTLKITGDAGLTISSGTGATALSLLDASGMTRAASAASGTVTYSGLVWSSNMPVLTGAATMTGGAGDDDIRNSDSSTGAIVMDGGAGADTLYGGGGNDTITDTSATRINPQSGVSVAAGNILYGQSGNDTITGGDAADTLDGGAGNDSILAGAGADSIFGQANNDYIDAGDGADTIDGGSGNDTIIGGTGDDVISTTSGNDSVDGGDGADSITGGAGNDILVGGLGVDTITAGAGNDNISGGGDNDLIILASNLTADDTVDGGTGTNTLQLSGTTTESTTALVFKNVTNVQTLSSTGGFTATLGAGAAAAGIVTVTGSTSADVVTLSSTFTGATLSASLGGGGNDKIDAGAATTSVAVTALASEFDSSDTVTGGTGSNDRLTITVDSGTADLSNVSAVETVTLVSGGAVAATVTNLTAAEGKGVLFSPSGFTNPSATIAVSLKSSTAGSVTVSGGVGDDVLDGSNTTAAGRFIADGGAGADAFTGGLGIDNLIGGDGNDSFTFATANFSSSDTVSGGTGTNSLNFSNSATVTDIQFSNVTGIAAIKAANATTLDVTLSTIAKAAGVASVTTDVRVTSDANAVPVATGADKVTISSGFTGSLSVAVGGGQDTVDGSASATTLAISVLDVPGSSEVYKGGTGSADSLAITGDAGTVDMTGISGIESITLRDTGSNSGTTAYTVTTIDANVASGKSLSVSLTTSSTSTDTNYATTLSFDGRSESNGTFNVTGGINADIIRGGAGADTLSGGLGADTIFGGDGADIINLGAESTNSVDYLRYYGTPYETGAISPSLVYYGGAAAAGTIINTSAMDKVSNFVTGDVIVTASGATGGAAVTVGSAWTVGQGTIRGTYDATAQTFVFASTGLDSMFIYDFDGSANTSDFRGVVLVGFVGTMNFSYTDGSGVTGVTGTGG